MLFSCDNAENQNAKISGSGQGITISYDENNRIIYVGESGEFVEYKEENLAENVESGNVVSLKIEPPKDIESLGGTTISLGDKTYTDIGLEINGQAVKFFTFNVNLLPNESEKTFSIRWTGSSAPQEYKMIINKNLIFLDENGEEIEKMVKKA